MTVTERTNERSDEWDGSPENRRRFAARWHRLGASGRACRQGVRQTSGAAYERVDDDGLHLVAGELDAKRAIEQGTRVAAAL